MLKNDLINISQKWNKLKIIDDDILQSASIIQKLKLRDHFSEIICSTRVDRINQSSIKLLKNIGITHVILGVETFDNEFIYKSKKSHKNTWIDSVNNAISLCVENSLIARPILMLLAPGMKRRYLTELNERIFDWNISNGIEVFFSFFTPHPGLQIKTEYSRLITNNLAYFDHLNVIYCPVSLNKKYLNEVVESYHLLVEQTQSQKYNPTIKINGKFIREYRCFFNHAQQLHSR